MRAFFQQQICLQLLFCLSLLGTLANAGIPDELAGLSNYQAPGTGQEIVFIDAGVKDIDVLINAFKPGRHLYVIDTHREGLLQVARVLSDYHQVAALHIISHGRPGELLLGNRNFSPANLAPNQERALHLIKDSLGENGDILIYGCNFGAGTAGRVSALALANLTGADISASTNMTGYGSDWNLELQVGNIESSSLHADSWTGILLYCYEDCENIWVDPDGDGINICQDPCPDDADNNCGVDLCPDDPDKVAPGACGCGNSDIDSDHDHHPDCIDANPLTPGGYNEELLCNNDLCPDDPDKTAPGDCGCGVADTDSDGDGILDCNDHCPNDMEKTEPGTCGCGVAETDSDGDGTPDCNDQCPNDMEKTEQGTCGCGVAETDSDGDGTPDCNDQCPNDMEKTEPGTCGCGVADTDSNGDGIPDCNDQCPDDPDKNSPGVCGCGVADIDSDGDGTPDCNDQCPNDMNKTEPGTCGCGVADIDSDGDGTPDCNDQCPNDMNKTEPGTCGCGVAETDSDGDGTPDCNDQCPNDVEKTEPGTCGCGVADTDSDGDGTPDCNDQCPNDMEKTEPGTCGCGVADTDSNGDGIPDCNDQCPDDPDKNSPGVCGCGVADIDSDNDGTPDCNDQCPNDMNKTAPGACGCGVADRDSDGNGTPDCLDQPGGDEPGFPWILFLHNFHQRCSETPDFCYMIADGDSDNSENSPLLKYDFNSGSLEMIGRLGVGMVEAITLSLDGQTLYAADSGILGVIDVTPGTTNAFTPINSAGIGSGNGSMGLVTLDDIDGLAFDPITGILYGSVRRFDSQRGVDLLVQIDHTTGTLIKDGFGTGVDYVVINTEALNLYDTDDLAFDTNGTLYGIAGISGGGGGDRLVVIDKQTGQVTTLGELNSGSGPVQDMEGLTFYHGGTLYGTTGFEFTSQGTSNTLYRIDKATGVTEEVIRLDRNFNGLVPRDFEAITCPICK